MKTSTPFKTTSRMTTTKKSSTSLVFSSLSTATTSLHTDTTSVKYSTSTASSTSKMINISTTIIPTTSLTTNIETSRTTIPSTTIAMNTITSSSSKLPISSTVIEKTTTSISTTHEKTSTSSFIPLINPEWFTNQKAPIVNVTQYEGKKFIVAFDLVEVKRNNTSYFYITDLGTHDLIVLDENGSFINKRSFNNTFFCEHIELVGESTIFCSDNNVNQVWNLDLDLNIQRYYSICEYKTCYFEWMFFEKETGLVYMTDSAHIDVIHFEPLTGKIVDRFSVSHKAYFITFQSNKIFIGSDGRIDIYNRTTKYYYNSHTKLCPRSPSLATNRFAVDINENIIYSCWIDQTLYLINSNGTKIGSPIKYNEPVRSAFLDSKGRLVVTTHLSFLIYD